MDTGQWKLHMQRSSLLLLLLLLLEVSDGACMLMHVSARMQLCGGMAAARLCCNSVRHGSCEQQVLTEA
jgi:hypothetical protein